MEDRLRAYRRQQQRQLFFQNIRLRLRNMIHPDVRVKINDDVDRAQDDDDAGRQDYHASLISSEEDPGQEEEEELQETPEPRRALDKHWQYCLWALYFIFWATCFAIAVELQFGAVFFVISALVGIYLNTRTGPKPKNEMSAYSVFNKNVESIDGTLKAEQFEREIRYGSMSVR